MSDRKAATESAGAPRSGLRGGLWPLGAIALLIVGFGAGRLSATGEREAAEAGHPGLALVQQAPQDPRELFPLLPGPGPGPGQGVQPGEGECPLYLYQDGRFYQFMPPGATPGPDGSPELFPLEPLPGFPRPPAFPPINPGPPRLASADAAADLLVVAPAYPLP